MGRKALAEGNAADALKKFRMAQAFEPSKKKEADLEIDKVFHYIEKQREMSKRNEIRALDARLVAEKLAKQNNMQREKIENASKELQKSIDKMFDILKLSFLDAIYKYSKEGEYAADGFSFAHHDLTALKGLGVRELEMYSLAAEYLVGGGGRPNTAFFYVWDKIFERSIPKLFYSYTIYREDKELALDANSPFRIYNEKYRKNDSKGVEELIYAYTLLDSTHIADSLKKFFFPRKSQKIFQSETELQFWKRKYMPPMQKIPGGKCKAGFNSVRDVNSDFDIHDTELENFFTFETDSFQLGIYEVTNAQYGLFLLAYPQMKKHQYAFHGEGDDFPVCHVSWFDAVRYCNFLSKLNKKMQVYELRSKTDGRLLTENDPEYFFAEDFDVNMRIEADGYRLPSELEWEYAAKGGESYQNNLFFYSGSNNSDEVAWHAGNSDLLPNAVGLRIPNEFELFDMSGNVWEWCNDWYYLHYQRSEGETVNASKITDKIGEYPLKVRRGGSWSRSAIRCRTSLRGISMPSEKNNSLGFRVALGK